MSVSELTIRGRRVALPVELARKLADTGKTQVDSSNVSLIPAAIHIAKGRIVGITNYSEIAPGSTVEEAPENTLVLPGTTDTHVHVNEPGRTYWEGFATATEAAAAGGVTTIVDMPLNSVPPTTSAAAFEQKRASANNYCRVDVAFWGGVIPGNTSDLAPLFANGVVGFKCFLIHSGVDEFPNVTEADLRNAMPELARLNALLIVHAEMPGPIDSICGTGEVSGDPRSYKTFLKSRPRAAENQAVELMVRLSREFNTRVHIVHHSSADALPTLREAKTEGVKITAETCPHYLCLAAEDVPDGATEFKCCPPIRERENRDKLWEALDQKTIDMIVSDHSPCPPEMKLPAKGDFIRAWGGISSLQLRLPLIWTAATARGRGLSDVLEWLCSAPAKLVGFEQRKGRIAAGYDADLIFFDPDQEFEVTPGELRHRHKVSPYIGQRLRGVVQTTFVRGQKVYHEGSLVGPPKGQLTMRPEILR